MDLSRTIIRLSPRAARPAPFLLLAVICCSTTPGPIKPAPDSEPTPHESGSAVVAPKSPAPVPHEVGSTPPVKVDVQTYEIGRQRLSAARSWLDRRHCAVPAEKDGVVVGLKIYGVRKNSLPASVGLRKGDLILSVNGESLADSAGAARIYAAAPLTSHFAVEVLRGGQPLHFVYRLTDSD
jgi:type II secretory pathway component PulC